MECFVNAFGKERIAAVLGDREFIGKKWLDYLIDANVPYVFRLKENGQYIANSRGKMTKINELLRPLEKGEAINLGKRTVGKGGEAYRVSALRNAKGELVAVMHSESVADPLLAYKRRWEIETMFKAFKSSGFDMEATHIVDPDRLNVLFSVVAIAFCFSYKAGIVVDEATPVRIKSHGRREKSVLRTGLDAIRNILANIPSKHAVLAELWDKILPKSLEIGG